MPAPLPPSHWKKGSVVLIHEFQFVDLSKAKFAVLMENWDNERDTIVFFLITSKMRFKDKKWTLVVPAGTIAGLPKDSLIDCNNWWELPKSQLQKCRYMGEFSKEIIGKIEEALTYAREVPLETIIRLRGIQI